METFVWLLLITGAMILLARWMRSWGAALINRPAIRQYFLQRLSAGHPDMQLVHATEEEALMRIGDRDCTLHFDQLYRRCSEAPTRTGTFVRQAIAGLEDALRDADALPADWEQQVVPLLLRLDAPAPPGLIVRPLVDVLAIGYALHTSSFFRWVTHEAVVTSEIDEEHLHAVAMRNLERSCNALVIDSPQLEADGRDRFLRFLTGDGLDAARVLLPTFYQRFTARFADSDLLVAIPSRDSLAMVSTEDHALANMLAWRSAYERARRAYPLYARLLHISEQGLIPWAPGESAVPGP